MSTYRLIAKDIVAAFSQTLVLRNKKNIELMNTSMYTPHDSLIIIWKTNREKTAPTEICCRWIILMGFFQVFTLHHRIVIMMIVSNMQ